MANSNYIYRFINSVWDFMPQKERNRFGELWKGYEQIWADNLQTFYELDQAININSIPVFLTSRWNKYEFNENNQLIQPATFFAYQDISLGLNLSEKYELKIAIDDEDPITVDCRGKDPENTNINEVIFAINQAFGFAFASGIFENTIIQLQTKTEGPDSKIVILESNIIERNAAEIIFGILDFQLPVTTPRLPFIYTLPSTKILSIPSLQNTIRTEILEYYYIEGPDYKIDRDNSTIGFRQEPKEILWAKVTKENEENPFYNFGWLIDYVDQTITKENYLLNLQGLWFAFWQGPKPELIRRALYLLFGLPISLRNGVVISQTENNTEILHDDNVLRTYVLPSQLTWIVNTGEYVERFQPLVSGIDVFDKVNLPGFVQTEIGRDALQQFALPEASRGSNPDTDESKALWALEEHTFLPQINVNAFVRPDVNVGAIFTFLRNIKPLHKDFYFQVIVAIFQENLGIDDIAGFTLNIDITPNLDINQANTTEVSIREEYEELPFPQLDLDSDRVGIFERGGLSFSDASGSLPQYDVAFD